MNARIAFTLTVVTVFLSVGPQEAAGGEFSAVINGKSFHLGASKDWRTTTVSAWSISSRAGTAGSRG